MSFITLATTMAFNLAILDAILSCQDRSVIRNTWDHVYRKDDVAPKILFRFLKAHPEYKKMFSELASVPQNKLVINVNFYIQSHTILAGLNFVIESLSSTDQLASQLNSFGKALQSRADATPAMFEKFGVVLEGVLAESLGSAFNGQVRQAWKNGIAAFIAGIFMNVDPKITTQLKMSC